MKFTVTLAWILAIVYSKLDKRRETAMLRPTQERSRSADSLWRKWSNSQGRDFHFNVCRSLFTNALRFKKANKKPNWHRPIASGHPVFIFWVFTTTCSNMTDRLHVFLFLSTGNSQIQYYISWCFFLRKIVAISETLASTASLHFFGLTSCHLESICACRCLYICFLWFL